MDGSGGLPGLPGAPGASAPLREESVQNAVAFLQHPKVRFEACAAVSRRGRAAPPLTRALQVRPSASEYMRAFLETKGLTAAEIAEAFRRVPEPPPGSAPPPPEYAPPPPPMVQYAPPPPPPPRPALSWSQARFPLSRALTAPESALLAARARPRAPCAFARHARH